jgi:hypothetical protein
MTKKQENKLKTILSHPYGCDILATGKTLSKLIEDCQLPHRL